MNRFQRLRDRASNEFGSDPDENKIIVANRAIELLEEWDDKASFSGNSEGLSRWSLARKKRQCAQYIKDGLHGNIKDGECGFITILISTIAFQLLVQLITKWIMRHFFDD